MSTKNAPSVTYLKDYTVPDFYIDHVFLHFDLNAEQADVKAVLKVRRNPDVADIEAPLVLVGEKMQLVRVSLNGDVLDASSYTVTDTQLIIPAVPDTFTLETEVVIRPQDNTELSGLYRSRSNFCTQCEPHGFRRITYFLDRPDVMARFTTTITADKAQYPYLLSNGNLIERRLLDDGRHWVRWEDPSLKPCYLFALVAGDFDLLTDQFVTQSGRTVDLHLYLEKGFKDQGSYALTSLKHAMKWDEDRWGLEYDLDIYMIVAVSDFNMGAMENKGLNIFNTKYVLAKPDTATDMDYFLIENVIGHEYFHNWTGNRVTCRDWFQITLKEGLTVFRDQSFSIDMTSPALARIGEVNVVRNQQFAEDAGPMAHAIRPESYIEINNFYTLTVYRKGAEVIRMVQTLITPKTFRQGLDLYFERYDGHAVTTDDFLKVMEDASGKDLTQFKRWYSQAGTPQLEIQSQYDAEQATWTLTVKQSCPSTPGQETKQPFHFPLTLGLVGSDCADMPIQLSGEAKGIVGSRVLEIKKPVERFTFINVKEKPIPSLLRNFSAPVKLYYPYTNEELAWLFQCDSDAFSRWDAGQTLACNVILAIAKQAQNKKTLTMDALLVSAFRQLLTHLPEDLYLLSQLLVLPTEKYLLSIMKNPDVDIVHLARKFVRHALAHELESEFLSLYEQQAATASYQYSVSEMGRRACRQMCLAYLTATEQNVHFDRAYAQFSEADNMTDKMAALIALNHHDCPQRTASLEALYDDWKHEPLVVNKWLSLQGASYAPDTLNTVQKLLTHPAFDIQNPNNVYALLGAYGGNTVAFHHKEGKGYRFLAEQVLMLDKINPQVAARMLQPLTHWKPQDKGRRQLMRAELGRIGNTVGISSDIYEIATKSS